jgi:L-threonylcarbamoyladenylate synthase
VFEIKGRPRFDPLIVHVASERQAQSLVKGFPAAARRLAEQFWPGPLSLVLPKVETVPDIVTAGLPTVAVRMPDHALALELLWEAGVPLAAPSANLFGRTSPTTAAHVTEQLGGRVDMVLDGGPCRIGLESTIVSFAEGTPVLLRPGGIPIEDIEEVVGPLAGTNDADPVPLSPGTLPQHYAPHTPLMLSPETAVPPAGKRVGLLGLRMPSNREGFAAVEVLSESGNLREAAASLFAALRRLDRFSLDLIMAQPVPERGLGRAIMDRLRKASTKELAVLSPSGEEDCS